MAKDDVTFNFGAEIAPLLAAMERSQEKVREATSTMSKSIESIGGALSKIQGAFMAFTAIATGGAAMRKIITDAGDWNIEALKLSKALGISTEKASEYQIALHRLGISNDTLITASTKMSKQIYNNHDAFVRLGVATKDTSGNFRPMAEVMDDVNAKLIAIKNPLEQNIAGNQVYGKGWAELRPLLKLTADEMAHAKEEGERLGLIVGPKGAEMAKTYKKSLADLDLAGKSLTVQMGQALLPAMTQVTSAFASAAPMIGEVFGSALILVAKVAINLGAGIAALGTHIGGLLAAAAAALSGNFAGAREVLKSMNDDVAAIDKKADDMIAKLDHPIKAGTSEGPDLSSSHLFDDENGGKSRAGEWAQQLAEAKAAYEAQSAAQGQFIEYSKEQERAFWQTKLGLTVAGTKEAGEIRSKVAEATTAIEKKNF